MYRGVHSGAVYTCGGNVGKVQVKRMKGRLKKPLIKRLKKKSCYSKGIRENVLLVADHSFVLLLHVFV
jgi:hypothetical protein